jgi:hypothetical protein
MNRAHEYVRLRCSPGRGLRLRWVYRDLRVGAPAWEVSTKPIPNPEIPIRTTIVLDRAEPSHPGLHYSPAARRIPPAGGGGLQTRGFPFRA